MGRARRACAGTGRVPIPNGARCECAGIRRCFPESRCSPAETRCPPGGRHLPPRRRADRRSLGMQVYEIEAGSIRSSRTGMAPGTARIRSRQGTGELAAIDPGTLAVTIGSRCPSCRGNHGCTLDSPARPAFAPATWQVTGTNEVGREPGVLASVQGCGSNPPLPARTRPVRGENPIPTRCGVSLRRCPAPRAGDVRRDRPPRPGAGRHGCRTGCRRCFARCGFR